MASAGYRAWIAAGKPWTVAHPIAALSKKLRSHGYTVYTLGDERHQTADVPEDHTPFSATGWPGPHPRWWVNACDIMPVAAGAKSRITGLALPSLQQLTAQMVADRHAGHSGMAWLKYVNWEPERDNGGPCWHDSWQPTHRRTTSSDRGHTHRSGRTDFITSGTADGYDPVLRLQRQEDDMFEDADRLMLREVHSLATTGLRLGPNQTAGGGVPIAWEPRQFFELDQAVAQVLQVVQSGQAALIAKVAELANQDDGDSPAGGVTTEQIKGALREVFADAGVSDGG
jgi:hypothetical protein